MTSSPQPSPARFTSVHSVNSNNIAAGARPKTAILNPNPLSIRMRMVDAACPSSPTFIPPPHLLHQIVFHLGGFQQFHLPLVHSNGAFVLLHQVEQVIVVAFGDLHDVEPHGRADDLADLARL